MSLTDDIRKRFGGFWNGILLIVLAIISLRFAGAEWKDYPLHLRVLYGVYLLCANALVGVIFGICVAVFSRSEMKDTRRMAILGAIKYGIFLGGILIFVMGLLMVDNYLGPFEKLFEKLIDKIP